MIQLHNSRSIFLKESMFETVPVGWEMRMSRSWGKVYYLNLFTKKSQWNLPTSPAKPNLDNVQVKAGLQRLKQRDTRGQSSLKEDKSKEEALNILASPRKATCLEKGLGDWEKNTKGIGGKLLLKMGFQPGKGKSSKKKL